MEEIEPHEATGLARDQPPHRQDDQTWWAEPDPVELFAAGLDHALRQLRVEVASVRAERDGLRLEVEGLRAKLSLAQQELSSRASVSETVRQLQAVVSRLTLPRDDEVFRRLPPVIETTSSEAPAPRTTLDPSALEQMRALGLLPPPRPIESGSPAPAPAPPAPPSASSPIEAPSTERPRQTVPLIVRVEPERTGAQAEAATQRDRDTKDRSPVVIWWEDAPTATTHDATDEDDDRDDDVGADADERDTSRWRRIAAIVGMALAAIVILVTLAVTVGPRVLPYQTYAVRSGSMEPTIATGSVLVVTKVAAETLDIRDIVSFESPDDDDLIITHRIVDIEGDGDDRVFVTQGDANAQPDPWRVPGTGDAWKRAFDVPLLGFVFRFLGTPLARITLVAVPLVGGALWLRTTQAHSANT